MITVQRPSSRAVDGPLSRRRLGVAGRRSVVARLVRPRIVSHAATGVGDDGAELGDGPATRRAARRLVDGRRPRLRLVPAHDPDVTLRRIADAIAHDARRYRPCATETARSVTTLAVADACHCTSPASWTATAAGRGAAACRAPRATPRARRTSPALVRIAVTRRHRLAHRVRVLDRELDPAPRRGPPHPRPAPQAVRPRRRAQRAERADPVDRPAVRLARGPHAEVRPAGHPQGDPRHRRRTPACCSRSPSTTAAAPGADRRRARVSRAEGRADERGAIAEHLYLPELPPVDVLVRTSGELRISNFLLWQSAGAAIHFTDKTWPEFDAAELDAALALVSWTRDPSTRPASSLRRTSPPQLPGAEDRPGQEQMAEAVGRGHRARPPPRRAGRHRHRQDDRLPRSRPSPAVPRVVVATATKALQDQLAGKDLPFLDAALPASFDWAVLKGRSNYVCLQRLRELHDDAQRASSSSRASAPPRRAELTRIATWVGHHRHGRRRRARLVPVRRGVADGQRRQRRVPRRRPLPDGRAVLRRAGARAEPASPTWWSSTRTSTGCTSAAVGSLLPEHDVVVFDEAHVLEDVMSDTVGVQIGAGPLRHAGRRRCGGSSTTRPRRVRRRHRRPAPRGPRAARRQAPAAALPRRAARRPRRGAHPPRPGERRAAPSIDDAGRGRQAAQAARPAAHRPGHRAPRPRPRRPRGVRRLRLRRRPSSRGSEIAPLDVGPALRERRVGAAHGGPHQRDHPGARSPNAVGLSPVEHRRRRRRQPVRLPAPGAAVLRDAPARPARRSATGRPCTTSWPR